MIAAIGSVVLTPWNLFHSPELIHYTLDVLGSFIGPIFGILLCDFYRVNRRQINTDELFNDSPSGSYWYVRGVNPKAIITLLPSVGLCLLISFIPALHNIASFSWFIGVGMAAAIYAGISRQPSPAVSGHISPLASEE
ncbi:Allantoin transport protein [Tatumella ptyseos]|nr:Allantoin transport protein [Tatumella ptyseos]